MQDGQGAADEDDESMSDGEGDEYDSEDSHGDEDDDDEDDEDDEGDEDEDMSDDYDEPGHAGENRQVGHLGLACITGLAHEMRGRNSRKKRCKRPCSIVICYPFSQSCPKLLCDRNSLDGKG